MLLLTLVVCASALDVFTSGSGSGTLCTEAQPCLPESALHPTRLANPFLVVYILSDINLTLPTVPIVVRNDLTLVGRMGPLRAPIVSLNGSASWPLSGKDVFFNLTGAPPTTQFRLENVVLSPGAARVRLLEAAGAVLPKSVVFRFVTVRGFVGGPPVLITGSGASSLQLEYSGFTDCNVTDAGVFDLRFNGNVSVSDCIFSDNVAVGTTAFEVSGFDGGGAAIGWYPPSGPLSILSISRTRFERNALKYVLMPPGGSQAKFRGGALQIVARNHRLDLVDCVFANNTCESDGGAFFITDVGVLNVVRNLWVSNIANGHNSATGNAVELYCASGSCNVVIDGLTARHQGVNARVPSALVTAPAATIALGFGGVVTMSVSNSFFLWNSGNVTTIGANGYGIYGQGGNLVINNTFFCNNTNLRGDHAVDLWWPDTAPVSLINFPVGSGFFFFRNSATNATYLNRIVCGAPLWMTTPQDSLLTSLSPVAPTVVTAATPLVVTASVTVPTSVVFDANSSVVFGAVLSTAGSVTILGNVSASFVATAPGLVTLLSYGQQAGTFAAASLSAASGPCLVAGPVTYGPTSASVLVSLSPACSSGLSTGAIIGIAVGAGGGGIALVLLVVIVMMCLRKRRDKAVNEEIRMRGPGN